MWTLTDLLTRIIDSVQPILQVTQHLGLFLDHLFQSFIFFGQGKVLLFHLISQTYVLFYFKVTVSYLFLYIFDVG